MLAQMHTICAMACCSVQAGLFAPKPFPASISAPKPIQVEDITQHTSVILKMLAQALDFFQTGFGLFPMHIVERGNQGIH